MSKKLPEVYVVPITKEINNNKEVFKSNEKIIEENTKTIDIYEIEKIFKEKDHVYKSKIVINNSKTIDIIGLTKTHILTLTGEKIPIEQIKSIKKV